MINSFMEVFDVFDHESYEVDDYADDLLDPEQDQV